METVVFPLGLVWRGAILPLVLKPPAPSPALKPPPVPRGIARSGLIVFFGDSLAFYLACASVVSLRPPPHPVLPCGNRLDGTRLPRASAQLGVHRRREGFQNTLAVCAVGHGQVKRDEKKREK